MHPNQQHSFPILNQSSLDQYTKHKATTHMHLFPGDAISSSANYSSPSSPGRQHGTARMGNCLSYGSKKLRNNYKSRSNHSRHAALVVPLDHQVHSYASVEKVTVAANIALRKRELEEPQVPSPSPPRLKKTVRFADDNNGGDGSQEKEKKEMEETSRVKVVMTKEAATLLLSMLADGKGRRVEDMLRRLNQQSKQQRSSSIATGSTGGREINGWTPALETIPEI